MIDVEKLITGSNGATIRVYAKELGVERIMIGAEGNVGQGKAEIVLLRKEAEAMRDLLATLLSVPPASGEGDGGE